MLCPECNKDNDTNAKFCQQCGADLRNKDARDCVGAGQNSSSQQETSGLAVASLVLGIVGFVIGWFTLGLPSILAVVFGHIARGRIRRAKGGVAGSGMALAGLILGYLLIGFLVVTVLVAIAVPAYQDYTIRARVHEVDTSLRQQVATYVSRSYELPSDIADMGIAFDSETGQIVAATEMDRNGRIRVTFSSPIEGQTIVYDPLVGRSGIESWECSGGTLAPAYRPADCRE